MIGVSLANTTIIFIEDVIISAQPQTPQQPRVVSSKPRTLRSACTSTDGDIRRSYGERLK